MATAWSLDFCLVCDRQTLGGAYCSQACRLAEMDGCATTAADSEPSSPTTTTPVASPWTAQGYQHQHQHQQPSALYLGPAIDFSGYKFPGSSSSSSSSSTPSMPSASRQRLSPSSSQTSLSSLHSVSSNSSSLSGQARSELENYSGSFDKVRDWKRRRTAS
ncbi:hypothetical protein BDBG_09543 [Blastomyces gilchristii SLH14081]|uniref:Life-span regulatory factor domain-containing protein n=1 Tax=Blastomyces gilchristii (strain SLH14081) TaxID=559298 RepID=A0A179V795_BLAGS|nr:uncharacterized protein BDBG_09543 [Blastomyces gilchristii SLH14081]OAT14552.1 hypothetical protein BDBG_09543 [Blastomyces gilchristii SLH14081]